MSINRNNYEEYFLLYMDDELSAEERKMVDHFVLLNQDLATELDALMALRLDPADNITFTAKQDLLKPVPEESTTGEKELEKLLLFIDNEMKESDIPSFQQELNQNSALQKELQLFKQTKLTPDMSVVFPDKSVLYRYEKQPARILVMRLVSVSVAAAVILIAGLLWMNNPETVTDQPGTTIAKAEIPEQVKPAEIISNEEQSAQNLLNGQPTEESASEKTNASPGSKNNNSSVSGSAGNFARVTVNHTPEKTSLTISETPVNNNPGSEPEIASLDNTQRQTVNLTIPAAQQAPESAEPTQLAARNIIDRPSATDIKSDYATEALMSAHESVEVVQADIEEDRRGPMRGLFRKANRLFNKVTNPDKDGPTVKVASFEIALAK